MCGLLVYFIYNSFYGCKEKVSGPPNNTPKPGKRDYVWSIDSIDYGGRVTRVELQSMWGSSASDVWGAAGDAPDVRDCLWHYNGLKWSRATAGTPITEFTGNKTVYAVWGTARNNVWAFGRKINQGVLSAFIMHFDGTRWVDATPSHIASISSTLYTVHGINSDNIWVGGYEYALHYNGSQWTSFMVAESSIVGSIYSNNTHIYSIGYNAWGRSTYSLFKYSGENFEMLDSSTLSENKFGVWIASIGNKLITFTDGVITTLILTDGRIDPNQWTREFSTATLFANRFVQNARNIFAVGVFDLIYHYNGIDWQRIHINVPGHILSPQGTYWAVWTDSKEVFICESVEKGIIYHGR